MPPFTRLAAAAASNVLLTGQILCSLAFVASCDKPNWISGPRETNACRSRSPTLALFFPSGMQSAIGKNSTALAPGRRGVFRRHHPGSHTQMEAQMACVGYPSHCSDQLRAEPIEAGSEGSEAIKISSDPVQRSRPGVQRSPQPPTC